MWLAELLWHGAALAVGAGRETSRTSALRGARRGAGRRCDAPLADARPDRAVYRRARPSVPALRDADPLARPGRREPHGVLVPGLPGPGRRDRRAGSRRGGYRMVAVRAPQLHLTLCARSARRVRVPPARARRRGRRRCRSRSRSTCARRARRSTSTGRSCATSSRRAPTGSRPRGRADRARGAARASRRPAIYARAHAGREPVRGRRALPHRPRSTADSRRRGVRRLRLGRHAFDRAYAELERSLFGERRAYAAVAPLVGISIGVQRRARRRGSACAPPPTASSRVTGRRRAGLLPAGFGREPDRYCVIELRAALGAGEDAAGRAGRDRGRRRRDPARDGSAARRRPGALRDARRAPVRDPAGASDRGDAASGRADPARRVPRAARRRAARAARRSPMRTRTSRRRSTAGSSRSSSTSRSARSSFARRSRRCSAAPGRSGRRCCSGEPNGARRRPTWRAREALRRLARGDAVRRALVEVSARATGGARRSLDRMLLGSPAGAPAAPRRGSRRSSSRRRRRPCSDCGRRSRRAARSAWSLSARAARHLRRSPGRWRARCRARAPRRVASTSGSTRAACSRHEVGTEASHSVTTSLYGRGMEEARSVLERLERIESMRRANAGPVELLEELRALLREAEAWAREEGGDAGRRRRSADCGPRWRVT